MDIKLPSSAWVRITPEDVLTAIGGRRREKIPAVAEILKIGGQPLPPSVHPPVKKLPPASGSASASASAPATASTFASSSSPSPSAAAAAAASTFAPGPQQQPVEDFDADMTGDDIAADQF